MDGYNHGLRFENHELTRKIFGIRKNADNTKMNNPKYFRRFKWENLDLWNFCSAMN